MRWSIKDIEIEYTNEKIVPVHMKLTTECGGIVTSAGYTLAEAAVTLFSTAGLGRHSPRALAEILTKKFGDRLTEVWFNELVSKLLNPSMV